MSRLAHILPYLKERGQSLVEVALVLPILVTLLVGIVEVSNLLITKNRVDTAARAATRFAAQGGEKVHLVALSSVTQTLDLNDGVWDIWLVMGSTNSSGDGFKIGSEGFEVTKLYGVQNTKNYTDVAESLASSCATNCFKDQILEDLQQEDSSGNLNLSASADLDFVSVVIIHDIDSILGLDVLPQYADISSVTASAVMRTQALIAADSTASCDLFPIAVHEGIRSLTDVGGGNPYPAAADFDHPSSPPSYNQFFRNVPQIPLADAKEGYIYRAYNGFGTGNFGWLLWNTGRNGGNNTLIDSLSWPGNSNDYTNHGDTNVSPATPLYPHIVRGYVNPKNALDLTLSIGDYVPANTGISNANPVRNAISEHVDRKGRLVRLLVWDQSENPGANGLYRIKGFIIARIVGYSLPPGNSGSWILIEFIRWDDSCGQ